jgi:hypothetical protein
LLSSAAETKEEEEGGQDEEGRMGALSMWNLEMRVTDYLCLCCPQSGCVWTWIGLGDLGEGGAFEQRC